MQDGVVADNSPSSDKGARHYSTVFADYRTFGQMRAFGNIAAFTYDGVGGISVEESRCKMLAAVRQTQIGFVDNDRDR